MYEFLNENAALELDDDFKDCAVLCLTRCAELGYFSNF